MRIERVSPQETLVVTFKGENRPPLHTGESVALQGICSTIVCVRDGSFDVEYMSETIRCTTVGSWREGDMVNFEQSIRAGDPIDGHIVQGHIDAIGEVIRVEKGVDSTALAFRLPISHSKYIVKKGSIALDGVSLTVVSIREDVVEVSLIPYTLAHTTLGTLAVGSKVHIETDIMARHIEKLLQNYQ